MEKKKNLDFLKEGFSLLMRKKDKDFTFIMLITTHSWDALLKQQALQRSLQ